MIWFVFGLILLISAAILLYPFFFGNKEEANENELGLSLYKSQLEELERDVANGVTTEEAAQQIRLEIQRRILKTSRQGTEEKRRSIGLSKLTLVAILVTLVGGSAALYLELGSPDLPAKPLALRDIEAEKREMAGNTENLENLVKRLAERLQEQPENVDGWVLLGRTLNRMGRFEAAANTFLQATKIEPDDVDLYVGAGESFYYHAKGNVSADSLAAFKKAEDLAPDHPGVRFYLALHKAESGDEKGALEGWLSLYADSEPTEPYMPTLRERISLLAEKLEMDVEAQLAGKELPEDSMRGPSREDREAAAEMSAADRQEMIEGMVAGLAERMAESPEFDGLMRLGQSYSTMGQYEKSADAYGRAAELKPDASMPLIMQALAIVQGAPEESPPPKPAIEIYKKVLTLDDSVAEAHWYVGLDAAIAKDKETALRHWRQILALVPPESPLYRNVEEAIKSLSATE
ncbi:MAG: c-type cytochrome biogenesis protein CcmI [Sneathiella sp.]|nr:c-type cytochrome biogenesis protein CcmI [Sneathiella sp.]